MKTIHRVGILIFDGVEVLDFAGPFEVFTTATRMQARFAPDADAPFAVRSVSRDGGTVQARAGLAHGAPDGCTLDGHAFVMMMTPAMLARP